MSQRTDIDQLAGVMLAEFARLHERFDRLEPRLPARNAADLNSYTTSRDASLSGIDRNLGDVTRRLDHLDEQIGHVRGFAKEIDACRDRLRTIETHLGIARQIV